MESICIRLDASLAKRIELDMKEFNYSTKTEFVREAIRDKLQKHSREQQWKELLSLKGSLKGKSRFKTDKEFYEWRRGDGSEMIRKHLEKKFGIKLD